MLTIFFFPSPLVFLPLPNLRREMRLGKVFTPPQCKFFSTIPPATYGNAHCYATLRYGRRVVFASLTQRALVLQATNTIQAALIAAAVAHRLVAVVHVPEVVVVATALTGTPPVAVVAGIAETAI